MWLILIPLYKSDEFYLVFFLLKNLKATHFLFYINSISTLCICPSRKSTRSRNLPVEEMVKLNEPIKLIEPTVIHSMTHCESLTIWWEWFIKFTTDFDVFLWRVSRLKLKVQSIWRCKYWFMIGLRVQTLNFRVSVRDYSTSEDLPGPWFRRRFCVRDR